jgi:hypothetical protein
MQLALLAIKQSQIKLILEAIETYKVLKRTLRNRLNGIPSRNNYPPNSKKLINLEE